MFIKWISRSFPIFIKDHLGAVSLYLIYKVKLDFSVEVQVSYIWVRLRCKAQDACHHYLQERANLKEDSLALETIRAFKVYHLWRVWSLRKDFNLRSRSKLHDRYLYRSTYYHQSQGLKMMFYLVNNHST